MWRSILSISDTETGVRQRKEEKWRKIAQASSHDFTGAPDLAGVKDHHANTSQNQLNDNQYVKQDGLHHDDHDHHLGLTHDQDPHEPGWVIKWPLVLLAIPSVLIGFIAIEPMLFRGMFNGVIYVDNVQHSAMTHLSEHYASVLHSPLGMALHGFLSAPLILAVLGVGLAWFLYIKRPDIPARIKQKFNFIYVILENKYGFDRFNERVFASGARALGHRLWQIGDVRIIDGALVNGTARLVSRLSGIVRQLQSGLIYHYAFAMIIGVFLFLTFFIKIK